MSTFQPKSLISIASKCIVKNYSILKKKLHTLPQELYTIIYKYNYRKNYKLFEEIYNVYNNCYTISERDLLIIQWRVYENMSSILEDLPTDIVQKTNLIRHKRIIFRYFYNTMNSVYVIPFQRNFKCIYVPVPHEEGDVVMKHGPAITSIKDMINKSPLLDWKCMTVMDKGNKNNDSVYI